MIIAVYSNKGGVGKSTTVANLAYLAARSGRATLLFDLDPQGATSFFFRVRARVKGGVHGLLGKGGQVERRIKGSDFENLDLLPADPSYRHLDLALDDRKKRRQRLRKLLAPLRRQYDCIFLDCPPNLTLVAENVFRAAEVLLVPVIPTPLSVRTLEHLLGFLDPEAKGPALMPFFSMVDARKKIHQEVMLSLPRSHPEMLATRIPYLAQAEWMGAKRAPLNSFSPRSRLASAFRCLWSEIESRCGGEVVGASGVEPPTTTMSR